MMASDVPLLYQNHMLDSSACGSMTIVLSGPGRTFSPEDPPKWIKDLPSQREQLVGQLDVDDVRKNLGLA